MKIILRKKPSGKGKSSLYLDLYINGQRHYEFLKLHLFQAPKTTREREHNKETEQLAENIKAKRQLELQNTEHGFRSIINKRVDFLEFFLKLTREREATGINYHCWDSVSKHLTRFLNGKKIRVESVDERFLKGFKEHLLSVVSTNSAQNYFHKVQSALHEAIRRGIITRCEGLHNVEAPRHEETKKEFLTIEELRSLTVAECKFDVLKRAFLFSALTSLRWSDVHALCWENVKYSENTGWSIHFTQQKTHQCEYLVISQQARDFLGEPQESKSRVFVGLKYSAYMNAGKAQFSWTQTHVEGSPTSHTFFPDAFMLMPLVKLNDKLFLDAQVEIDANPAGGGAAINLNEMIVYYRAIPGLSIFAGNFSPKYGLFAGTLDDFTNRYCTTPIGMARGPHTQTGIGIQGGIQAGYSKFNYQLYISNGPQLIVDSTTQGNNNLTDPYEFLFLNESGDYTMLDVRRKNEVRYQFQGAVHLPLEELSGILPQLDRSRQYLVYCINGYRSAMACAILKAANFTNVYNLENGIEEVKLLIPKTLQYC